MVKFDWISKKGDREQNEDYTGVFQKEDNFCFVLADGLGGHGNGDVASQTAVNTVLEEFKCNKSRKQLELSGVFLSAQANILKLQENDIQKRGMRTTLVVLELTDEYAVYGHIGDSRLYVFQNGKMRTRTLDHSVPQMLVNAGEIKEKKIRNHPDRNRLLRALGEPVSTIKHELTTPIPLRNDMAFLLCSDGFWELIEEKRMESCLRKSADPAQWLEKMELIVQKNGKKKDMDNYSAIAIWITK